MSTQNLYTNSEKAQLQITAVATTLTFEQTEVLTVETLKQEAIKAISKLPETANIDDIMYELYVVDKVKKGREAIEELKREMQSW
jgi:hypothetical protein